MLAAVLLSGLALAGPTGDLWISSDKPQEGRRYRAMTLRGPGELECGGVIGNKPLKATVYAAPNRSVCVIEIPKGSAGKWLRVGWAVTFRNQGSTGIADGIPFRRLIRH